MCSDRDAIGTKDAANCSQEEPTALDAARTTQNNPMTTSQNPSYIIIVTQRHHRVSLRERTPASDACILHRARKDPRRRLRRDRAAVATRARPRSPPSPTSTTTWQAREVGKTALLPPSELPLSPLTGTVTNGTVAARELARATRRARATPPIPLNSKSYHLPWSRGRGPSSARQARPPWARLRRGGGGTRVVPFFTGCPLRQ